MQYSYKLKSRNYKNKLDAKIKFKCERTYRAICRAYVSQAFLLKLNTMQGSSSRSIISLKIKILKYQKHWTKSKAEKNNKEVQKLKNNKIYKNKNIQNFIYSMQMSMKREEIKNE